LAHFITTIYIYIIWKSTGSYSPDDHLELDYLIPLEKLCLIGEISSRKNQGNIKRKYKKFKTNIDIVSNLLPNKKPWSQFGLKSKDLRSFRGIKSVKGFFILTELEYYDVPLEIPVNKSTIVLYEKDWELIKQYVECIGEYSKMHFLHHFGFSEPSTMNHWIVNRNTNQLIISKNKKIGSGNIGLADVYTFEMSPYEILPYAQVYRKDNIPDLTSEKSKDYQRPLISQKLNAIRKQLIKDPDFLFPNNILIILSNKCKFDANKDTLMIPKKFGAISVIDGQHRLFSYADNEIKEICDPDSKIMITAIRFQDENEEDIIKHSAQTFVEINSNQTKIHYSHIDTIAYEILDKTDSRALAAQVLMKANNRKNSKLFGIFQTNQTLYGKIQTMTVLTTLKKICDFNYFCILRESDKGIRGRIRNGYINLFEVSSLDEIDTIEKFIDKCEHVLQRYFRLISQIFKHDWPRRREEINSTLEYAKAIAALLKLLWQFMKEEKNWTDIQSELKEIKNNIMTLRDFDKYNEKLLKPEHQDIPDAKESMNNMFKFFDKNRSYHTSIQDI